jgi:hypothetical protein
LRIHRVHLDALTAYVLHELRRSVKAHRLAVDQCRGERGRLVALEPRRDVDQQREACRVRLREAVFAETEDLPEDLPRELLRVATLAHAADQPLLEMTEAALALPRGHRAAQLVGLARREARRNHRELHHLLLEDRHAERALEHALDLGARVVHRLEPAPPAQIRVDHAPLDRPWPDDGHLDHEIVVSARLHARQHRHLRARLDLEHAIVAPWPIIS